MHEERRSAQGDAANLRTDHIGESRDGRHRFRHLRPAGREGTRAEAARGVYRRQGRGIHQRKCHWGQVFVCDIPF